MSTSQDKYLSAAEVAALFGVAPKTVGRWADAGRIPYIRTPGGHRRYRYSAFAPYLRESSPGRRPRP